MDLKQLRVFTMVAETGSLSKASDRLRVAQPALSRHIKLLEDEIGQDLFVRTGRGMLLTEAGSEFLARISGPISQLEKSIVDVRSLSANPSGQVSLGIIPSASYLLAGRIAIRVARELPDVTLRIVEGYGGHLIDWLHRGDIDAIMIYGPGADLHLRVRDLVYEELFLVAPDSSGISETPIPLKALEGMQLVLPSRPHGLRSLMETAAEKAGVTLNVKYEADSFRVLKELVEAGFGNTVLPLSAFFREQHQTKFRIAKLVKPQVTRQIVLALPSDRSDTRATLAVINLLQQEIQALIASGEWKAFAGTR